MSVFTSQSNVQLVLVAEAQTDQQLVWVLTHQVLQRYWVRWLGVCWRSYLVASQPQQQQQRRAAADELLAVVEQQRHPGVEGLQQQQQQQASTG